MAEVIRPPESDDVHLVDEWALPFFCRFGDEPALPPFRVILVTPVGSNTFRVFFASEPRHYSPLSDNDALNRLNYVISIVSGPGTIPVVEGVEDAVPRPTTFPDEPDAWSVDLRLNQRALAATNYLTIVSNLESARGVALAPTPYDRDDCPGDMAKVARAPQQPTSTRGGVDFLYDTLSGYYVLDAKRDIAVHSGIEYLKKRILRRLMSRPGGFYHLPRYGLGFRTKEVRRSTDLARLRSDVDAQVREEEGVRDLSTRVQSLAPGVLLVALQVSTTFGRFGLQVELDDEGRIFVS